MCTMYFNKIHPYYFPPVAHFHPRTLQHVSCSSSYPLIFFDNPPKPIGAIHTLLSRKPISIVPPTVANSCHKILSWLGGGGSGARIFPCWYFVQLTTGLASSCAQQLHSVYETVLHSSPSQPWALKHSFCCLSLG